MVNENTDEEEKNRQKERFLRNFWCDGLDPHNRSMEFIFEVGNRPQTAEDNAESVLARKIDSQAIVATNLDVSNIGQRKL